MADLRHLIGKLGFTEVRTLQSSGNVVFSGAVASLDDAARSIEEAMVLKLGVAARAVVLSCDELDAIIDANPLAPLAADPSRLLTFVVNHAGSDAGSLSALAPLCSQQWDTDAAAVGPRAAYVWCPQGVLQSPAAAAIGRLLGDGVTARNWSTLLRLQKLCKEGAAEETAPR